MKLTNIFSMCALFCCLEASQVKAQWYGQQTYAHDSTILCSAIQTALNPGYAIAGFRPQRQGVVLAGGPFDFVIDQVDANGNFPIGYFSKGYKILANPGCSSSTQVYRCNGVSIIESPNLPAGGRYMVVGSIVSANRSGIFCVMLTATGNVTTRRAFWPFQFAVGNIRKPVIRESTTNPGQFYICGNYQGQGYVMKIGVTATSIFQIWGNQYGQPEYIEPRDLIESPYNANELIVVGRTDRPLSAADGMFMSLDATTGAVNFVQNYTIAGWDSDDWFSCIELAASPNGGAGYVLGGRVYGRTGPFPAPMNPEYAQWMCKLDQFGNVVWSSLIQPAAVPAGGFSGDEISRVYERYNTTASPARYEYYGSAADNYAFTPTLTGIRNLTVYKLDDNGLNTLAPDEFHYIRGEGPDNYTALTGIETGGGTNDGFQAFGSLQAGNIHYFVKSYFNGVSGCAEDLQSINTIYSGPQLDMVYTTNTTTVSPCGSSGVNFNVTSVVLSPIVVCSSPTVGGGSNARIAVGISEALNPESGTDEISVYPNPVSSNATLSFSSALKHPAVITVVNILGQKIKDFQLNQNETELNIDFDALQIESGVYVIQVITGKSKSTYKVIYQPD